MSPPTPLPTLRISVVLVTDAYRWIRGVVSCLRRQSDPSTIELILVASPGGLDDAEQADFAAFGRVHCLEIPSVNNLARARAAGVRAATAPLVFLAESHVYPRQGWLEAILRAHEHPCAAVVPGIGNADCRGAASWAGYLLDYSRWGPHRAAGELKDPLVYNTSFNREVLLGLGDRLDQALDPLEEMLWPTLFAQGHKARFEPAARVDHLSPGLVWAAIRERLLIGLMVGGSRSRRWPWGRRILYFLAGPLIPFVLFFREWPVVREVRRTTSMPLGVLPLLALLCVSKAMAEMFAYLFGTPSWTEAQETEIEIQRLRFCPRGAQ